MIAFVEGEVCEKTPDFLIITQHGIGLRINYDPLYSGRMPAIGEKSRIYTYLNVRENELSLYGFPAYEEKQLFELLITVSGIGAKVGSTIVASISPAEFALAILNADVKRLTKIKGVGKKSAERLILELKDKLKKAGSFLPEDQEYSIPSVDQPADNSDFAAAVSALEVLGYTQSEARPAVMKIIEQSETQPELNDLIRLALKSLATM